MKPYVYLYPIIKIPHFFEDDVYFMCDKKLDAEVHVNAPGLKVFGFHPVHIFLNSENLQRYQRAKPYYRDALKLREFRNSNFDNGAESFLRKVIQLAKSKEMQFCRVREVCVDKL